MTKIAPGMTIPPPRIVSPDPDDLATAALAPIEVAILRFPGAQATSMHGIADVLAYAEHFARERAGSEGPFMRVSQRIPGPSDDDRIACEVAGRTAPPVAPTIVVLPAVQAGPVPRGHASSSLAWLRRVHADGAVVSAVCGGVFLLADAGLLAGRRATTHWMFAAELERRHPDVKLDVSRMVVDDGDIVTAGGVLAWADLALTLVDRLLGREVMLDTARFINAEPPRAEQRIYGDFAPSLTHGDAAILLVQRWMQAHPVTPLSVTALADRAGLGARTFLRRFVKATGLTPGDYHRRLRITRGRELLALTRDPVEAVAASTGYDDAAGFRRTFKRVVGLSPAEYRRRFQGAPAMAPRPVVVK